MYLVAGESLIDLVATEDGTYVPVPGGAPYNFARALALQAIPATYLNPFSEDAFGALLSATLQASGAMHSARVSNKPTSLALVTTSDEGHPHYSFYREGVADRELDLSALTSVPTSGLVGFHTGALALVPPDHQVAIEAMRYFRAQGILCTIDVNMRPQVARSLGVDQSLYRAAVLEIAGMADVVKLSDEDLVGLGVSESPEVFARALLNRSCKLVVFTFGASGARAISTEHQAFQPAHRVQMVDTVGAGDCFFAGFIASLHRQGTLKKMLAHAPLAVVLEKALRHASVCAAINIERKGCQPPTWQEAMQWQPR